MDVPVSLTVGAVLGGNLPVVLRELRLGMLSWGRHGVDAELGADDHEGVVACAAEGGATA